MKICCADLVMQSTSIWLSPLWQDGKISQNRSTISLFSVCFHWALSLDMDQWYRGWIAPLKLRKAMCWKMNKDNTIQKRFSWGELGPWRGGFGMNGKPLENALKWQRYFFPSMTDLTGFTQKAQCLLASETGHDEHLRKQICCDTSAVAVWKNHTLARTAAFTQRPGEKSEVKTQYSKNIIGSANIPRITKPKCCVGVVVKKSENSIHTQDILCLNCCLYCNENSVYTTLLTNSWQ